LHKQRGNELYSKKDPAAALDPYRKGLAYLDHALGLCERGVAGSESFLPLLLELQLSLWANCAACLLKLARSLPPPGGTAADDSTQAPTQVPTQSQPATTDTLAGKPAAPRTHTGSGSRVSPHHAKDAVDGGAGHGDGADGADHGDGSGREQRGLDAVAEPCAPSNAAVVSNADVNAAAEREKQLQEVVSLCGRVLHADPSNAKALFRRGVAWRLLGELERARADLQAALGAEQAESDGGVDAPEQASHEQGGRLHEIKAELGLVRQLQKAELDREKDLYKRMLRQHT